MCIPSWVPSLQCLIKADTLQGGLVAHYGFRLVQVIVRIFWRVISYEEDMNVQRDTVAQLLSRVES